MSERAADTDAGPGEGHGDPWWSPRSVACGQTLEARLGTLVLKLAHHEGEWALATEQLDEDSAGPRAEFTLHDHHADAVVAERFIVTGGDTVELVPMLADRPVVIRPRSPVSLLPGSQTTMYLSTPVTLRIQVRGTPPLVLREVPMLRLSDTWFGPSTREGELCYAGRTHARHALEELPRRVHRVITAVRIVNHAPSALALERISLPVPVLSVFGASDGRLWTQAVSLQRSSDSDMAALRIDDKPPAEAGAVEPLSGPRQQPERGGVVRAFSLLFRE